MIALVAPALQFVGAMKEQLSKNKVLVVDPNEKTRIAIAKILLALGVRAEDLYQSADYGDAYEKIHSLRPEIVISEYVVTGGNGIDLAGEFNKLKSSTSVFIMLTENALQSTVAMAAEEDVDAYVLRPHTAIYFVKMLTRVMNAKANPTEYTHRINHGKQCLVEGDLEGAIRCFNHAILIGQIPTLAYYYRSQVEVQKLLYDGAEQSLKDGLRYNPVHYKCLNALFDLLLNRGKFRDAYEIAKKLAGFPLGAKRLSRVLDLAVRTAHYSDIERYYEAFKTVEVRDVELTKHMSAALVVSSKMLFQRGEMYKAASYLKKASAHAGDQPNILLEAVATLVLHGFVRNAREALNRFPKNSENGYQYRIARAMIAFGENAWSGQHVTLLKQMIAEGAKEPECFYWLIAFLQIANQTTAAEEYLEHAKNEWPEKSAYFENAKHAIPSKPKEPVEEV